MGLGELRGPGTKMSRAGSGAHTHKHTHTHTHTLAPPRACLLRHTSVHAFILAGTTHLQICNSAHACLHAQNQRCTHTFLQTHLAQENACKDSLYSREALQAFALGRVPRSGMGEGVEEPSTRISFRVSPSPQPSFFFFLPKSIQAGVSRRTGERGTWRSPERGSSPEPRDLHYLHPLIPRPGSSLSLRARAAGPTSTCLRLGARGLLLPSRPPHPRSKGRSALPP